MNATTVAVDLAKSVFQLAVADEHWRVIETQRLTRTQFERWFANRDVSLVIMEACGSAHHWGRWLNISVPTSNATSPARHAPHPLALDGHAHQPHQRLAWVLS
jgi:hypothetical protein